MSYDLVASESKRAPVPLRPVEADPAQAAPLQPTSLPRPLTSLIGREAEIAVASALLLHGGVQLLTLTGPGGVGKTRLALRIAEENATAFADGALFVPLAPLADSNLVLSTVARTLGLRESGELSLLDALIAHLQSRHLLLILDNFEHLLAATPLVTTLREACPSLTLLITSRVLLHLSGEQIFPVSPLALPAHAAGRLTQDVDLATLAQTESVRLFVERARSSQPSFALTAENAASIAAICRQVDGLPLAIELAATRLRVLSSASLLAGLEHRLRLLTDGPHDVPERLRTMRNAIAWSYDLLPQEEQALFRRLAIFAGGFSLEAAETIGYRLSTIGVENEIPSSPSSACLSPITHHPSPPSILDLLASLVDKSLIQRSDQDGETRFTVLETIREFALEQLEVASETESVAVRHASWCIDFAEAKRRSGAISQPHGLTALENEQPNMRAALTWLLAQGDATAAQRLAGALAEFWFRHGHLTEGEGWLELALAADDGRPTVARANALVGLTMMFWPKAARPDAPDDPNRKRDQQNHEHGQDGLARADDLLREAEAVARAAGDVGALAYTRLHQGYVAAFQGNMDLAAARGEECLLTAEAIPQAFSLHGALWLLAASALERGDHKQATDRFTRLLHVARAGGDVISLANAHNGLAMLAERRGDAASALPSFVAAAEVCRGYGDRLFAGLCLEGAAASAITLGWREPAVRLFAVADALFRTVVGNGSTTKSVMDRRRHLQALTVARTALSAEQFATLWQAGSALSLAEAIAEARAVADMVTIAGPRHPANSRAGLTPRERDVLRLLVEGSSDKEIAAALGLGRRTVSNYVAEIRAKLAAPSRSAAAAIAIRDRLI